MNSKTNLNKIGAKKSHRKALISNILSDLIIYEHLKTTKAKAKAVKSSFDNVIKVSKTKLSRIELERKLTPIVINKIAVAKLIDVFSKRFENDSQGLVKTFNMGRRKGDGAEEIRMIVRGYEYKEIGKKTSIKDVKDNKDIRVENKKKNQFNIENKKETSQVAGKTSPANVKTRSGI